MHFQSSKLHDIKKWQTTRKEISIKPEVSIKTFCGKWKGETLPKRFFIFKQLGKYQNEYYPNYLNLVRFFSFTSVSSLLKRKSAIILKITNL